MSVNFLLKRSSTADRRPTAAQLDVGELALNYEGADPGIFFEDSTGAVRKVGPVTVSATAPNSSPAGVIGNSVGESWLDTSVTPNEFKVWDGSAWQSAGGGGTPGGNTTEVQFNNAGAFDGNANFTFNDADEILSITEVNGRLDGAVIFVAESGEALSAGDVVYVSSVSGNFPVVSKAQANSSATMPAFGIVQDAAGASGSEVRVTTFGDFTNFDTSTPGWSLGDTLYVSDSTAGGLVNAAPAGEANLIQNIGKVGRVSASVGRIKVGGAGRTNATPNLDDGNIFIGNASNQSSTSGFNAALTAQAGIDGSATTATRFTLDDNNATFGGTVVAGGALLDDNGTLFFEEATANGSNYMAFQAPAALTTTSVFQLPDGDGTSGQRLVTNGSGVLSWASSGAGALTNGNIFVGDAGGLAADVSMSGDITIDNTGATTIANDAVTTVKILDDAVTGDKIADSVALAGTPTATTQTAGDNSVAISTTAYVDAAVTASKSLNDTNIFVGNGSNVATGVAMSGDVTIANTGATTIANNAITSAKILDDTIVNADINSAAAIDHSKLADITSAQILVGNAANVPTSTAISGDVTLSNTGVVDIINDVNLGGNPTTTTQADTDNSTRVATTAFVHTRIDNAIEGLSTKQSVAAASTGDLTLSGTQTVDGIALVAGDRILVKDQASAEENGIYVVDAGAWARSDDASTWDELVGAFVFVTAGTTNADSGFTTSIVAGGTLGTTAIPWTQFSSAGQVTAGAGLTKTGSTLDVVTADATRIVVNTNDIDLATTGVAAGTYTSVTTDTYGRVTAGTTPTTFAGYSISDTSANLAAAITDETGTGSLVFGTSPALGGTPTAPTATAGDNSTTIATTAYADNAVGSKLDTTLSSAQVFVGNGSNVATGVALSGDATVDNTGALTIANDAVTTAKILDDNVTGDKIANDVALAGNPTTTTQSAGTNNTTIATTAYTDSAVAGIAGTYVDVSGDTMTGSLILDDTTLQITEAADTLTLGASALTADRAVNFQDAAGDIALVGAGSVDARYVAVAGDEMTGNLQLASQSELRYGDSDNSNFIGFQAPATVTADVTFTLPDGDGTGGQVLSTDGSGALSWSTVSGGTNTLSNGDIYVGNASNVATGVTMSGDITIDNTGAATIASSVALGGSPTTTTQTAGTSNTTIATTAFVATAVTSGSVTLNNGEILVGDASNVAQGVTPSGDVTFSNAGATTIANDAVTTVKILDANVTGAKIESNVALAGSPTTTTQAAADNSTKVATTAYADAAVAAISGTYVDAAGDTMTGSLILDDTTLQITEAADTLTLGASALTADRAVNFQDAAGDIALVGAGSLDTRYSTSTLSSANIFVGNASNVAAGVSMSGDATLDNAGAITIANDAVTTAKISDANVTGTKIESNVALAGSPTTTTATAGDNSTKISTTAYVDSAIAASNSLNDTNIFVGNGSNVATGVALSGDATISNTGALTIANDAVTTAKIIDDAVTTAKIVDDAVDGNKIANDVALAGNPTATTQIAGDNSTRISTTAYVDSAVAASNALNDTNIFVGNGVNVATGVALSGDATIANTGALTIANDAVTTAKIIDGAVTSAKILDDTIVNTDINSAAAIAYSKLAALTSASLLVGNGSNVATVTAVSGDVTLSNTGVVDIIDDVNLGGNPTTTTQLITDDSTRVATTAYVTASIADAVAGLKSKLSVAAASTGNLTLSGTQTVDGIALSAGDRILVKDQANAEENGLYVVAAGAWSRSSDGNVWDELVKAFTFVEAGTVNANVGYVSTTSDGGTLGTTAIPWAQFSTSADVTAGAGMTKTGTVLNVITADSSRIVVNSDDIDLATTGVAAGTYQSLTVDTYGRITAGTTPTTFAGYNISDTSANLAAAISDETGTGSLVFATDPALAGTPTAPTATAGTNSTQIATTAYTDNAVAAATAIVTALTSTEIFVGNASNVATGVALSGDATIDNTGALTIASSVALAGSPTTTTQSAGDNSTKIATTAYADSAVSAAAQWENNSGEIRPTTDGRNVVPVTDGGASIGTASLRWSNIYTQDMHFSNEGTSGNSVDGTTGNWTLQEGEDEIYMINNKTGKTYSIVMKERS